MINTFNLADHVVGFIVTDPLNRSTAKSIHDQIDDALENHEQINLYVENTAAGHIDFGAIFADLKFKMARADRFSKIAIVTNDRLFTFYCRLKTLMMIAELRVFNLERRTEALLWLSSVT